MTISHKETLAHVYRPSSRVILGQVFTNIFVVFLEIDVLGQMMKIQSIGDYFQC